jgi:hypothetical protein
MSARWWSGIEPAARGARSKFHHPNGGEWKVRAENLREAIHAQPFRPFVLMLADGTRWQVSHPEWIMQPPGTRTAVVMGEDESVRILDVALILGIEVAPPVSARAVSAGPNGGE